MLKSMHTVFVEYAMLVDLKAHKGNHSSTFTLTVTHELTQGNIAMIAIFIINNNNNNKEDF